MLIQVSLRAVHELKFAKKAVTLTSQKSPLRVSLSLSHTHFGLPQGFDVNVNFPTNIFFTFIWKSSGIYPQHRHMNSDDFGGHLVLRIEDQKGILVTRTGV